MSVFFARMELWGGSVSVTSGGRFSGTLLAEVSRAKRRDCFSESGDASSLAAPTAPKPEPLTRRRPLRATEAGETPSMLGARRNAPEGSSDRR
jgi:hypothetical protein